MTPSKYLYLVAGLFWLITVSVAYRIYSLPENRGNDYRAYYQAAENLNQGSPLYEGLYGDKTYLYPPLLAITLRPLAAAGDIAATKHLWFLLNLSLLIATIAATLRHVPDQRLRLVIVVLSGIFSPVFLALVSGQATVLMFASVTLAWVAYRDERPGWAGVLLAAGVWIKIYSIIPLLYFVWKRDWRVARGALIAGVGLGLLQLLIAGADAMIAFVTQILPAMAVTGQRVLYDLNVTITGFVGRLTELDTTPTELMPQRIVVFLALRLALSLAVVGITVWLSSRPAKMTQTPTSRFDLEYAAVLLATMLIGSQLTTSGMLPMILAHTILLNYSLALPSAQRRQVWLWCGAAYLVNPLSDFWSWFIADTPPQPMPAVFATAPFLALVILWVLVVVLLKNFDRVPVDAQTRYATESVS